MNIDIQKLKVQGWKYIQVVFPKTFELIREWNFSRDDDDMPYHLDLNDRKLYDFFDKKRIMVCPIYNNKAKFYVQVYLEYTIMNNSQELFIEREDAEAHGFLIAMAIMETQLNIKPE